jgi:DNA-binding response OmpR family regulator
MPDERGAPVERSLGVLVASPDERLRGQVALALDGERYSVAQAETTDAAIHDIAERLPAVLVVDLQLGGRGALALARTLRSQAATASVRVLLLAPSGQGVGEDAEGIDGVLATPFTSLALLRRLESILER